MGILTSKTFWGSVVVAVAHAAAALGKITPEQAACTESVGGVLFGVGVRHAIAKNGKGK